MQNRHNLHSRPLTVHFESLSIQSSIWYILYMVARLVLTTSAVQVTVTNLNASGNGAFLTITGIIQAAGSIIVNTANNGGGALGSGDNVLVSVWVLN